MQLLQSQGWELLASSLKAAARADRRGAASSAASLDELIDKNRLAARAETMLTLVDLPSNMLLDIEEELQNIYEDAAHD